MAYKNLRAEMARERVTGKKIARVIDVRLEAVYKKLNGKSPMMYEEALAIRNDLFPHLTLEYLFEQEGEVIAKESVNAGG